MESDLVSPYSQQSKLAAYRSVSAQGAVADADPHALVLTVMDATLARLATARACIEHREIRRKAGLLHSSVILIAELRGSLDLKNGGQLAQNLSDLYEYMTRRLIHANLNDDVAAVGEVASLLGEVREAWAAMPPQVRQAPSRVTTSAA